jgi:hypothetical protein
MTSFVPSDQPELTVHWKYRSEEHFPLGLDLEGPPWQSIPEQVDCARGWSVSWPCQAQKHV